MSCTALLTGSTEVRRQQMDATRGTEFVGLFKERIILWAMVAMPTLSLQHTARRQRLAVIPLQESCVWGRRARLEETRSSRLAALLQGIQYDTFLPVDIIQ